MNKYDRFYDEACSEARDVINGWMNDKLRDELDVNNTDERWHEDSDVFLKRFLTPHVSQEKPCEPEIDFYGDNESTTAHQWMQNMHSKLSSFTLPDYEAAEKKKKPIGPKDPRLAMEVRQQKVKEARAKREEKTKLRLQRNMERKQSEAIAREIVKQETFEKARKEKFEEEAVQREMVKIRKQMLEIKKKHEVENNALPEPVFQSTATKTSNSKPNLSFKSSEKQIQTSNSKIIDIKRQQHLENIRRFELFQQHKSLRRCFHHWIKIVLSKRAVMGKAKALSDWHLMLKTWSAWRKYYFEQAALKDTQKHEENIKQMKVFNHVATVKHRQRILKKCFLSWRKFVKMEHYAKELLREQEDTKKKMDALLGFVQSKAISTNSDLVLQTVEEGDIFANDEDLSEAIERASNSQKLKPKSITAKPSIPKHAWQVRKSDVRKLTLKQIQNMAGDCVSPHDLTRVKKIKAESAHPPSSKDRINASKTLIAQQREMITQQKQVIEEQKRLLNEKGDSDKESIVSLPTTSTNATTKVRTFQPPKRPKSVLAMEKRAEERLQRKEELQERKRQAEIERIEKLRQEEEEEKRKEDEEKKRKQEELRRLKQLEIEKENERKAFIAKMQQLRRKAEDHYKKTVLRKYGLTPWLKLIKIKAEKMEVARYHYETKFCRKVFITWYEFLKEDRIMKESQALHLHKKILIRRCFHNWLKYGEAMSILEAKADIHRNGVLLSLYLRKWEDYVTDERLAYFSKEELADEHNIKRLKKRGFRILLVCKQNIKREQIRSQRLADMRRKVAQLLPDFDPEVSQDTF